MVSAAPSETLRSLHIEKDIVIAAPVEIAFAALLAELGPESMMPGDQPFPFVLEAWPGGRWYRDLGNNAGHLWGHVQVIKPPTLLEIRGPMFMSYAASNHLQYRLRAEGEGTRLSLIHRGMGQIPEDDAAGVVEGWAFGLERVRQIAEARA